jgi:hypothetical protein
LIWIKGEKRAIRNRFPSDGVSKLPVWSRPAVTCRCFDDRNLASASGFCRQTELPEAGLGLAREYTASSDNKLIAGETS